MKNSERPDLRYVILRDDDTNALTPVACLERLYRPFLARGLPVNLAVIPEVRAEARRLDGAIERFVALGVVPWAATLPLGENSDLVAYLRANPLYHLAQHGCFHDPYEFDRLSERAAEQRLVQGARLFQEADLAVPRAFVAPHDRLSRASRRAVARRFNLLSTGWFEFGLQPVAWWPRYFMKKLRREPHWRVGRLAMLSHPGCLLAQQRPLNTMLATIQRQIAAQRVTVLVTHWWEYFLTGAADDRFIDVLHQTADYLATAPDVRVISFATLVDEGLPLA